MQLLHHPQNQTLFNNIIKICEQINHTFNGHAKA
jgi:hypothetical protein